MNMDNLYIMQTLTAYVKSEEYMAVFLSLNRKYNHFFSKSLREYVSRIGKHEKYEKLRNDYNSYVKYAPRCNVELKSIQCIDCSSYQSLIVLVSAFPIYLQGHDLGVRFTVNNWKDFADAKACWKSNEDGKEIWETIITFDKPEKTVKNIEFAIWGKNIKNEYNWDNNNGSNYVVEYLRTG
jgi:hypothetical protein